MEKQEVITAEKSFIRLVPNRFIILIVVREKTRPIFNPTKEAQFSSDNTQMFREKHVFCFFVCVF